MYTKCDLSNSLALPGRCTINVLLAVERNKIIPQNVHALTVDGFRSFSLLFLKSTLEFRAIMHNIRGILPDEFGSSDRRVQELSLSTIAQQYECSKQVERVEHRGTGGLKKII